MQSVHFLGYFSSFLILVGMAMTSLLWLRIVGVIGSLSFTTYGVLIGAWPVAVANGLITLAHAIHLRKLLAGGKARFDLLPVSVASSWYYERFLAFHAADIRKSHPAFNAGALRGKDGFFILRDMLPVGLLVYAEEGRDLRILLDYVIPDYRDLENAHFAYGAIPNRIDTSRFDRWIVRPDAKIHDRYFRRLGFKPVPGQPDLANPIVPEGRP